MLSSNQCQTYVGNCTNREWAATKVDSLHERLAGYSASLASLEPVWKKQFISLFAFLPWYGLADVLLILGAVKEIKVRLHWLLSKYSQKYFTTYSLLAGFLFCHFEQYFITRLKTHFTNNCQLLRSCCCSCGSWPPSSPWSGSLSSSPSSSPTTPPSDSSSPSPSCTWLTSLFSAISWLSSSPTIRSVFRILSWT